MENTIKIAVLEKDIERLDEHLSHLKDDLKDLKDSTINQNNRIESKVDYIEKNSPNKNTYTLLAGIVTAVVGFGFSLALLFFR